MTERITTERIGQAIDAYTRAATSAGILTPEQAEQVGLARPYGQVWYLVRYDAARHAYLHDLPGFIGSGGSGFISKRQAYDRIQQASRTIWDTVQALPGGPYPVGQNDKVQA